jgi:para-nitrobenzyl esterase
VFRIPALRLAEAQREHSQDVFTYRFDWRSPLMGGIFRACHAIELGFMWGTHGGKLVKNFFGDGPEASRLSHSVMDAWIAFARSGNPSNNQASWTRYDDRRPVMVLSDKGLHSHNALDEATRRTWDTLPDKALGT